MKSASRAQVASSFTIVKGALIEETYAVFSAWDLQASKQENLHRLRADNTVGARSAAWLRDIVKVINRRFQTDGRDRSLVLLAKGGLDLVEWKPLLLWHMTRDEFLVRDFIENWLFPAFEAGTLHVGTPDVESYLAQISARGAVTEHPWSPQTTRRVAGGLLKIAADFGLLRGSASKEFASFHLPERSFLYLLHAMRDAQANPGKVVSSPAWRLFLMRASDVEQELLRLHQFKKLGYQVAGSLVELSLPCASTGEYAGRMVA